MYSFLISGFVLLIKGADLLVDGASSLADKHGISHLVIGFTIVSFGTSAPELLVNVISSLRGNNGLIWGNVLGSNIANIFLILGVSSIIYELKVKPCTVWYGIPFAFLAMLVGGVLVNDRLIDGQSLSLLSRIDSIIMFFFFSLFMCYTYSIREETHSVDEEKMKVYHTWHSILMIIGGMIGLAWGGQIVVDQAVKIARIIESFGDYDRLDDSGYWYLAAGTGCFFGSCLQKKFRYCHWQRDWIKYI